MSRIPVHASVVVVVEDDRRFLLALEERGLPGGPVWYFPAGAWEPGESLADAARREVLEETGYTVEPLRVVRVDHGTFPSMPELFWWRCVVAARLLDRRPAATTEAGILRVEWIPVEEIASLRLRAADAPLLAAQAGAGDGLGVESFALSPDGTLEGFIA